MNVYVLFRHDGMNSLVLGVFHTSLDARIYVQQQFGESPAAWSQPRPGRQHWSLDQPAFTYSIEEHTVNFRIQPDSNLSGMRTSPVRSNEQPPEIDGGFEPQNSFWQH
ncbi:MAG: hypothetical protein EA415_06415 [Sphaerobacteraceae bacterium]|nr:MAG: hypothetical protein EA415_06415 [Sphaerobacteraceae bacterium]